MNLVKKSIFTLFILAILIISCGENKDTKRYSFDETQKQNETKNKTFDEVVLVTGDLPPYVDISKENYGCEPEIVSSAFDEVGIKIKFKFYPWNRCQYMVEKGTVFATFPYSKNEEREDKFLFSSPILWASTSFFYDERHIKKFSYNELTDLKSYRIGALEGYFYIEMLENAGLKLDSTDTEISGIKKLIKGRIDLIPIDSIQGRILLDTNFPDDSQYIQMLKKPLVRSAHHLMVSKTYPNSKEILKQFEKGLNLIKEKGVYDKILDKFNVVSQE